MIVQIPSNKFDGFGFRDPHQEEAHRVLSMAVDDEIRHRGWAKCSETFACFIEHRIAEALRNRDDGL